MTASKPYDYLIKLLLIGDSGVGKSCMVLRFSNDSFTPSFITTVGIDFKIRTIELDGKRIRLQIWDTAGQERFRKITTAYYRGAMGILMVYDVTDQKSFENIRMWIRNIEQHAPEGVNKILIGNKCDMNDRRIVSTEQAAELAREYNIKFIECSAKTNTNIDYAFSDIARQVKRRLVDLNVSTTLEASQTRASQTPSFFSTLNLNLYFALSSISLLWLFEGIDFTFDASHTLFYVDALDACHLVHTSKSFSLTQVRSRSSVVEFEGVLQKRRQILPGWPQRLFILKDSRLFYFIGNQPTEDVLIRDVIVLQRATYCLEEKEGRPFAFLLHCYNMYTRQSDCWLDPGSAEARDSWIDALKKVGVVESKDKPRLKKATQTIDDEAVPYISNDTLVTFKFEKLANLEYTRLHVFAGGSIALNGRKICSLDVKIKDASITIDNSKLGPNQLLLRFPTTSFGPISWMLQGNNQTDILRFLVGEGVKQQNSLSAADMLMLFQQTYQAACLALAADLSPEIFSAISTSLSQNQELTKISLEGVRLQPEDIRAIVYAAQHYRPLSSLNLSHSSLSIFAVTELMHNINSTALTWLDLGMALVGDPIQYITQLLPCLSQLHYLSLRQNQLTSSTTNLLFAEVIRLGKGCTLTHLSLESNRIDSKAVDTLTTLLQVNTTIQHLIIFGNKFNGNDCAKLIEKGLSKNHTLVEFDLETYPLTTTDAATLQQYITRNIQKSSSMPIQRPSLEASSSRESGAGLIQLSQLAFIESEETRLGRGSFGVVYRGMYQNKAVAIKKLISGDQLQELLKEISTMSKIPPHPNVLQFLGMCINGEGVPLIVLEFCNEGDLVHYLQKNSTINQQDRLSMIIDIAKGLEHLSKNNTVHRDVRADNMLVHKEEGGVVITKISDFGLTRHLGNDPVYNINSKMPIRWMAPECLKGVYETASDVWSFGIVIWEIQTNAQYQPYTNIESLDEVGQVILAGQLPAVECPPNCPENLFSIMQTCWKQDRAQRPTFTRLLAILQALL